MKNENRGKLRQQFSNQRNQLSVSEVIDKSKIIFSNLSQIISADSSVFHTFVGSIQRKEVNTITFLVELFRQNKSVWIPFIDDQKEMFPSKLESLEDLTEGPFGLLQPSTLIESDAKYFEVILIPGLVFDLSGNRLGYGKGYYDRFLSDKKESLKIGLCFDFQIVEKLESENWDIKMDFIVSEKQIIKITE